jgi:hypothetical protein
MPNAPATFQVGGAAARGKAISALCREVGVPSQAVTWTRVAMAILAVAALIVAVLILLPLFGIDTGIGPFASQAASPSASASPSAEPSPSESASPSQPAESIEPTGSAPAPDAWTCGEPFTLAATAGWSTPRRRSARTAGRITFSTRGRTQTDMQTASPPFTQDASGNPMTVNGSPVADHRRERKPGR